jgi:hypothetical protein
VSFSLLLAVLTVAPNLTSVTPGRDSGVFLYVGSQILEGEAPYLEVWDHKGPLMYLINAAAVWMDPGGEAGIWLLEIVALGLSGILLSALLRRRLGVGASLVALGLFYGGTLFVLRPGNYTEEFAMPVSLGALVLLDRWDAWPVRTSGLALGAAIAAGLLLRPNLALTQGLVAVYVLLRGSRLKAPGRLPTALSMVAGMTMVVAPVTIYLAWKGAVSAAWDAYIVFNFAYLGQGSTPPLEVVREGLATLLWPGVSPVGVLGWVVVVVRWAGRRLDLLGDRVLAVAALDLPVEVLLTAVGGRGLTHYYLSWLPSLGVLGAMAADRLIAAMAGKQPLGVLLSRKTILVSMIAVALVMPLRRSLPNVRALLRDGPRDARRLVEPLESYPEGPLLMWGAETAYHYFSGRPAASRFVYQYPLYTCGYATEEMVEAFRHEIEQLRPLIVDTSSSNLRVPPLDPDLRGDVPELEEECALSRPMVSLMESLWAGYYEVGRMPDTGWPILAAREAPTGG